MALGDRQGLGDASSESECGVRALHLLGHAAPAGHRRADLPPTPATSSLVWQARCAPAALDEHTGLKLPACDRLLWSIAVVFFDASNITRAVRAVNQAPRWRSHHPLLFMGREWADGQPQPHQVEKSAANSPSKSTWRSA